MNSFRHLNVLIFVTVYCLTPNVKFVIGDQEADENSETTTGAFFLTGHLERMHQRYMIVRAYRRQEIRNKVLEWFGWTSVPQIGPRDRARINNTLANISSIRVTERQCFSASCNLPNRIDENMWNDSASGSLRVLFDVLPSEASANPQIVNATLKLHLKARVLCNCDDDLDTERVSVKVMQYLKPLRRRNRSRGRPNRRNVTVVRQRILWTALVPWTSNTWVSIPVQQAANDWIVQNRRNHGFEILVFDQYDQAIDANTVFSGIECVQPAEVDCMETTLQQLYGSTSPILEVYKTESPFVNQRRKRHVVEEDIYREVHGRS
uniref:Uncharacterized protein LOC111110942 isoform X2 n=1 Tax=Crassostrea virginica TaxID=6565 RepID=A0A8B8BKE3_CRAVI|nr:uncharacterized protein LOC111110942 isoform X2 [Crassostrea virginica]